MGASAISCCRWGYDQTMATICKWFLLNGYLFMMKYSIFSVCLICDYHMRNWTSRFIAKYVVSSCFFILVSQAILIRKNVSLSGGFQLVFVLLSVWIICLYYDLFNLWHTIHMSTEILNSKIYLTLDVTLLCCRYWMIHHQYQRNMSMCIRRSSALSSVLACRKMLMQGQHASRYGEILFHII